jgi:hypothetical protein
MVQLTTEQRIFIVLHYNTTHSLVSVQNAFRERFPDRNPSAHTTILKNVRKYNNHGTSSTETRQILAGQKQRVPKLILESLRSTTRPAQRRGLNFS